MTEDVNDTRSHYKAVMGAEKGHIDSGHSRSSDATRTQGSSETARAGAPEGGSGGSLCPGIQNSGTCPIGTRQTFV